MCTGENRLAMLRAAYRVGFQAGRAEVLEGKSDVTHQTPENVIDIQAARESRAARQKAN